ncbi:hypothetical protein BaRGS_00026390, partial [Batillaria attramentaria]
GDWGGGGVQRKLREEGGGQHSPAGLLRKILEINGTRAWICARWIKTPPPPVFLSLDLSQWRPPFRREGDRRETAELLFGELGSGIFRTVGSKPVRLSSCQIPKNLVLVVEAFQLTAALFASYFRRGLCARLDLPPAEAVFGVAVKFDLETGHGTGGRGDVQVRSTVLTLNPLLGALPNSGVIRSPFFIIATTTTDFAPKFRAPIRIGELPPPSQERLNSRFGSIFTWEGRIVFFRYPASVGELQGTAVLAMVQKCGGWLIQRVEAGDSERRNNSI